MENLLNEPFIGFVPNLIFLVLSLTGSIFLAILSFLYSDPHNLQFGHVLSPQDQPFASRNLIIASFIYLCIFFIMIYELILNVRKSRKQSWDPSIAMVDVHTPKEHSNVKRPTSSSPVVDSTVNLSMFESSSQGGPYSRMKRRSMDHGSSTN